MVTANCTIITAIAMNEVNQSWKYSNKADIVFKYPIKTVTQDSIVILKMEMIWM